MDTADEDAWTPWQLASFDTPGIAGSASGAPQNPATASALPAATLEEIARLRQKAEAEGRTAGLAAGYAAGYAEGQQQARHEAVQLAALISQLDQALNTLDQQVADEILALSLELARQVIRHSLTVQPALILDILREALAQSHHTHATISVHPEDAALIRRHADELLNHSGHRLREDPRLQRGGCLIDAGGGQIDASLETRWRRVVETLGSDTPWLASDTPTE
ncbi:MAG: flagellar assembly protein FliH [Sterolibacterium sp.]|jgi:flagellar assembly protein FliH|nr:flagellar assembly protein FliH [Sterolibacterium sp.]